MPLAAFPLSGWENAELPNALDQVVARAGPTLTKRSGLFIPQNGSSDSALLRFVDPEFEEFALALDQASVERIDAAILAVEAAKEMAFFDYGDISCGIPRPH